ncbi:MAG: hypothetical protein LBC70_09720 [Chitinispirillales bacterium]|jgi:hypothetical protein|nr:hypothetical protein [Chitinispirillales bacterium]
MSKRPLIFFCDDKLKWTGLFKHRHGGKIMRDELEEVKKVFKKECAEIEKKLEKLNGLVDSSAGCGSELRLGLEKRKEEVKMELEKIEKFMGSFTEFWEVPDKEFDVETINLSKEFIPTLKKLIEKGKKPDIILIDLFHPRTQDPSVLAAGEAAIENLQAAIEDAKEPIYRAWEPCGFDMLRDARMLKECADIPIAIYTEQGLTLAGNIELQKVSQENGEWMLKGQSDYYETSKLRNISAVKHYVKATRNTLLGFAGIIFVTALAYSYLVERNILTVLSFGATLTSLSLAIMPYIIERIDRRTLKRANF